MALDGQNVDGFMEMLPVVEDSVVLVSYRVTPSCDQVADTVAAMRRLFPRNKVLVVNGNLDVSVLDDVQLRKLGLARIQ